MLVSATRYAQITGDTTSATGAVEAALADAQSMLEAELRRGLELAERTERVRVHPDGRVYPSSTPLTAGPAGSTIAGVALVGAVSPMGGEDDYAEVTYTGGFDPDEDDRSAVTCVPVELARAVAWAARAILTPADGIEVPAGATSVAVGDVSVSWGPGGSPATGEIVFPRRLVRRWRHRTDGAR